LESLIHVGFEYSRDVRGGVAMALTYWNHLSSEVCFPAILPLTSSSITSSSSALPSIISRSRLTSSLSVTYRSMGGSVLNVCLSQL